MIEKLKNVAVSLGGLARLAGSVWLDTLKGKI